MRGHRHTVILVDDEGEGRDALRDHLMAMGVDVLCARHGRAALQLTALGIRPCAFVVDVESPAVAGAELRRALQYDAVLRLVPVGVLPSRRVRASRSGPAIDVAELLRAAGQYCPDLVAFRRLATPGRIGGVTRTVRGPRTRSPSRY
jgi:CheY-like chemotaxis protein